MQYVLPINKTYCRIKVSVIPQISLVRAIPYTIDLGKHGKRIDWQCIHSSKTKRPNDVDLLLGKRLRRCPNTNSTSGEYLVFTEIHIHYRYLPSVLFVRCLGCRYRGGCLVSLVDRLFTLLHLLRNKVIHDTTRNRSSPERYTW